MSTDVVTDLEARLHDLRSRKKLDAVVEASHAAVLVAVPRLRVEHESVLRRRGTEPPISTRPVWGVTDTMTVVALLLALGAAALVLPSPRNGRSAIGIDDGAPWVGLLAALAVTIFAVIERGRRDTYLLGAHTRGAWRLFAVIAVVWAATFAYILMSWGDVDRFEPQLPTAGLVLLGISTAGMVALIVVSRRHDRFWLRDPALAAKDEWGVSESNGDPVAEWWTALPTRLTSPERSAANRSYATTIDVLERAGVIRPRDARRLRRKKPHVVWAGDAG